MTKDTEKVLLKLYRAYTERRKTLPKSQAKHFASEDVSAALPGFPKAIEYGETAVERGIDKALDVWSKLH